MAGNIIQCNYDDMRQISNDFSRQSDATRQMFQTIQNCLSALQGGGWLGKGAQNFYREMEDIVSPAMQRLGAALADASSATQRIATALEQAEREAGALFMGGGDGGEGGSGGNSGVGGGDEAGGGNPDPRYQPLPGTEGNTVPAYLLNFRDPNFNMTEFMQNLNPEGRPVIFMVHGFREQLGGEGGVDQGFAQASRDYSALYDSGQGNGKPPIIIGVTWDAGTTSVSPGNYYQANANAAEIGPRFGNALEQFRQFHPESQVNVVAHSLGNRFVLEGLAANPNARIDNYLAVQPAVNQSDFQRGERGWFGTSIGAIPEGRFYDVVNGPQMGNMAATYNTQDRALWAHATTGTSAREFWWTGTDTALGGTRNSYDGMQRISLQTSGWNFDMNHHSYHSPEVLDVASRYFGLTTGR